MRSTGVMGDGTAAAYAREMAEACMASNYRNGEY
jgi:hypothetical protein